jgi:hypothetical protein
MLYVDPCGMGILPMAAVHRGFGRIPTITGQAD